MDYSIALTLGPIIALVLAIVLYIKVLPRKLDGTFNKPILQFLHDFFHFKKLYLEEVLKFIFTLATIACIVTGVLLLISVDETYHYSYYGSYRSSESTFFYGLGLIIGGPIALRLTYESIMMFILLVKNVMEINNKLKGNEANKSGTSFEAPAEIKSPFAEVKSDSSDTPPTF